MSLLLGIDCAEAFFRFLKKFQERNGLKNPSPDNHDRRWFSLLISFSLASVIWVGFGVLAAMDSCFQRQKFWLSLVMAPPGVWLRWYFSRFNGKGLGKSQRYQWIPFGTLGTNVGACVLEAIVALMAVLVRILLSFP